ncbi:MAG TPA: glycosyltransferase family 2 protein [Chloroflexota bacterium]|nr:glycosyltransferase family 2 protein [Chloroflexota bacterium]
MRASVIIPTFNRCASLTETLIILGQQTFSRDEFEVIVVDDGSMDDTPSIQNLALPYRLRYLRQVNQGAGAARNLGAVQAEGDVLIFIDDDMSLAPGYIGALVAEHDTLPNIVGIGAMYPYIGAAPTPFDRYMLEWYERDWAPRGTQSEFVHFTKCTSNNMSVERNTFFQLGQWRDVCGDGQTLWGDVEFGYRAQKHGMRFRYCPTAICYHRDYAVSDLKTQCARVRRTAELAHDLFRIYPELESELEMYRDMSPIRFGADQPSLVARKLVRILSATPPMLNLQELAVAYLERAQPTSPLLKLLYRRIIGAYNYLGYRKNSSSTLSGGRNSGEARELGQPRG